MIDRAKFDFIKSKYGHFASWAVWGDEGSTPKANMGDLRVLDPDLSPGLLSVLNPDVVLIGLNISRPVEFQLGNFHDRRPQGMDYKLRLALRGTPLWGGYMTDIIKDFEEKVSGKVASFLRANRTFEEANIRMFRTELSDIGATNPMLVALGSDVHAILSRNFGGEYRIVRLPHYSNYISKEKYYDHVMEILEREGLHFPDHVSKKGPATPSAAIVDPSGLVKGRESPIKSIVARIPGFGLDVNVPFCFDPSIVLSRLAKEFGKDLIYCIYDAAWKDYDGMRSMFAITDECDRTGGAIKIAASDARRRGPMWFFRIRSADGRMIRGKVERHEVRLSSDEDLPEEIVARFKRVIEALVFVPPQVLMDDGG